MGGIVTVRGALGRGRLVGLTGALLAAIGKGKISRGELKKRPFFALPPAAFGLRGGAEAGGGRVIPTPGGVGRTAIRHTV